MWEVSVGSECVRCVGGECGKCVRGECVGGVCVWEVNVGSV